jgi:predicted nuclease of predicted toxin-antitoxin system
MESSSDDDIFDRAAAEDRILVSADTDFASILASRSTPGPSLILFRRQASRRPQQQLDLLHANLLAIADALQQGCVAVLEEGRLRVRMLPLVDEET